MTTALLILGGSLIALGTGYLLAFEFRVHARVKQASWALENARPGFVHRTERKS